MTVWNIADRFLRGTRLFGCSGPGACTWCEPNVGRGDVPLAVFREISLAGFTITDSTGTVMLNNSDLGAYPGSEALYPCRRAGVAPSTRLLCQEVSFAQQGFWPGAE
jgi:hypothetical protein